MNQILEQESSKTPDLKEKEYSKSWEEFTYELLEQELTVDEALEKIKKYFNDTNTRLYEDEFYQTAREYNIQIIKGIQMLYTHMATMFIRPWELGVTEVLTIFVHIVEEITNNPPNERQEKVETKNVQYIRNHRKAYELIVNAIEEEFGARGICINFYRTMEPLNDLADILIQGIKEQYGIDFKKGRKRRVSIETIKNFVEGINEEEKEQLIKYLEEKVAKKFKQSKHRALAIIRYLLGMYPDQFIGQQTTNQTEIPDEWQMVLYFLMQNLEDDKNNINPYGNMDPQTIIIAKEQAAELLELSRGNGNKARNLAVFLKYQCVGISIKKLAIKYGKSEGTIKRWLKKGKEEFKKYLKQKTS